MWCIKSRFLVYLSAQTAPSWEKNVIGVDTKGYLQHPGRWPGNLENRLDTQVLDLTEMYSLKTVLNLMGSRNPTSLLIRNCSFLEFAWTFTKSTFNHIRQCSSATLQQSHIIQRKIWKALVTRKQCFRTKVITTGHVLALRPTLPIMQLSQVFCWHLRCKACSLNAWTI